MTFNIALNFEDGEPVLFSAMPERKSWMPPIARR